MTLNLMGDGIGWNKNTLVVLWKLKVQNMGLLCHNVEICCYCVMDFNCCPFKG